MKNPGKMNRNKIRGLIGLVAIVIAANLILQNVGGTTGGSQRLPSGTSRMMDIPYYSQKRSHYCGQASVQMVLMKIQDHKVSQFRLDPEMDYRKGIGTKLYNIKKPFDSRGIEIIRDGKFFSLNGLRKSVDNNHYSIIAIKFDKETNTAHCVVVTGYNGTGFFVHDPWPEGWGAPSGREGGENAFVDSAQLRELWFRTRYWVIVIGTPEPSIHELVELGGI